MTATDGLTLYLVRHGQTGWNRAGRFQGQKDVPLDDEGRRQAGRVARALAEVPLLAVYASDLIRARQTAEPLARVRGLAVTCLPGLREMDFGEWEGLTRGEVLSRYPGEVRAWYRDPATARVPGGEALADFWQRVASAFHEVTARHPRGAVAVFAHGGSLRVWLCLVLDLGPANLWDLDLASAAISVVEYRDRRPRLTALNVTSHLRGRPGTPG